MNQNYEILKQVKEYNGRWVDGQMWITFNENNEF
jgi:hypothetical protein